MSELTTKQLTFDEAQALTSQIRDAVENLWELIKQAHDGGAFRAMGYETWGKYVDSELHMSRRHSERLVNFANVRELAGDATNWSHVPENEAQARPLTSLPPEQQREAWTAAVENSGGQPTAKDVAAAVEVVKQKNVNALTPDQSQAPAPIEADEVIPPMATKSTAKRGSSEDWKTFQDLAEEVAQRAKAISALTVPSHQQANARDLAAKLAKQFTKISEAQ